MSIKLTNAAIDIFNTPTGESIIIRGVIDPGSLSEIKSDSYQREIGTSSKIGALAKAFKESTVPDVELGMRGNKTRASDNGTVYHLQDETYVIDGLQRISGARYLMQTEPGAQPRVGCVVHLDTTFEWELERFRILNAERSKLAGSVLLRNQTGASKAVFMLHNLCGDKSFVLADRICWQQKMLRNHILSAVTFIKVCGMLHARFGPARGNRIPEMVDSMDKMVETLGQTAMRSNIKAFFDLLDRCFGLRIITFSHGAAQVKGTFLLSFADLFTQADEFWRNGKLFVSADLEAKIRKFPIQDPEVARLAGSSGKAKHIFMGLLLEHINSGKRTKRISLPVFGEARKQDVATPAAPAES